MLNKLSSQFGHPSLARLGKNRSLAGLITSTDRLEFLPPLAMVSFAWWKVIKTSLSFALHLMIRELMTYYPVAWLTQCTREPVFVANFAIHIFMAILSLDPLCQATPRPLPTLFPSMSRWMCWSPAPGSLPLRNQMPPSFITAQQVLGPFRPNSATFATWLGLWWKFLLHYDSANRRKYCPFNFWSPEHQERLMLASFRDGGEAVERLQGIKKCFHRNKRS